MREEHQTQLDVDRWMDGGWMMDGWMGDEWMDGWMDGWMDRWMVDEWMRDGG